MGTFVAFNSQDITTNKDTLEQLVDILQNDISSSSTRKKYQIWVSGGVGPGITSSLWQTVFDQDFTLQTANAVFDMTIGLSPSSSLVTTGSYLYTVASTGLMVFSSQSVQMREKIDNYKLFAKELLGDSDSEFSLSSGSISSTIREPMFVAMKRLFARDRMTRETFAVQLYQTTAFYQTQATNAKIYTDVGSSTNVEIGVGGQIATIVDSANTTYPVGLLYLDKGIAVFDTQRVFDTSTNLSGTLSGISVSGTVPFTGSLNKLLVSGSLDNIIDHLASTRFESGSLTAMAFQNQTFINSTYYNCRFDFNKHNYSSNPTYVDQNGAIVVIDPGQEDTQKSFTFITGIGFYDAYNNLLAMAKMSRPVYKDSSTNPSVTVRLDW